MEMHLKSLSFRRENKPQVLPLTGMRIVLAMWVVVFHQIPSDCLLGQYMGSLPRPLFSLAATGYVAVGVFFVLSGFILALNYPLTGKWENSNKIRFGIARLARIYPVYLLGILLVIPVKHLIHHPIAEGVRGVLQISLLQSWWPAAALTWNKPGWSLSNEAFFYLIFPAAGVLLCRISRLRTLLMTLGLLWASAMIVPILTLLGHVHELGNSAIASNPGSFALNLVQFDPLLTLPQFLMGIASARVYTMIGPKLQEQGMWLYLPAIASVLIIVTHGDSFPYTVMHNGLLAPLSCCMIVGLALGGGPLCRLLSSRPMVFLGGASYAVYILHLPIGMWLERLHLSWYRGIVGMAFYMVVVVSLSSLAFRYLEEPANLWMKRKLGTWLSAQEAARIERRAAELYAPSAPSIESPARGIAGVYEGSQPLSPAPLFLNQ
jgi:peptidoglycan/LPS O-acetylase OafA/YrhL